MTAIALSDVIPGWELPPELNDRLDADLLARAYRFSERAHSGQVRRSGEPYVTHCVEVARILAELQLDSVTVAGGLMHDVVEDTAVTVEDVRREFGDEVARIVDGLTKIGALTLIIGQLRGPLEEELRRARIEVVEVSGRVKHLWSIHKKMESREKDYDEIYDLLAIRVIVNTVPECYHALGVIHDGWTPVQERIKDYIAQPKSNGYQSRRTGSTRRARARAPTTSTGRCRGSARCSSCSSTPAAPTSSSSSSSSTSTRTRSSSSRRPATSSSSPGARRRSTSPSPCTPRSAPTARGPRSTARSPRSPAS